MIRVVELHDAAAFHAAAELLRVVWHAESADTVVNPALMTALSHSGNYVAGAYAGDQLVGAAVAFRGPDHLHSHVVGVDARLRKAGVGYAIKQHQRDWAQARNIGRVCWTFDPLIGRNAYFNLHKLGAYATQYLPDFYGQLSDGFNLADDPTDRLYISWDLGSPNAVAAAAGRLPDVDPAAMLAGGAAIVLEADGDKPKPSPAPRDGRALLVAVPRDIEKLRGVDAGAASAWRYALREAMVRALSAGYRIRGITRDGYYALSRDALGRTDTG